MTWESDEDEGIEEVNYLQSLDLSLQWLLYILTLLAPLTMIIRSTSKTILLEWGTSGPYSDGSPKQKSPYSSILACRMIMSDPSTCCFKLVWWITSTV